MRVSALQWKIAAGVAAGFIAIVAVTGVFWFIEAQGRESRARLDRLVVEKNRLISRGIAVDHIEAWELQTSRILKEQSDRRARWPDLGIRNEDEIISRTQAYFELAGRVEKWRSDLAREGIVHDDSSRFGFASYAKEGPDEDDIGYVLKQLGAVDHVLGFLSASGTDQLVQISRTRPGEKSRMHEAAGDYFEPGPGFAQPRAQRAEKVWLRLKFAGHTTVLRFMINALAGKDSAAAVRDVRVESVELNNTVEVKSDFSGERLVTPAKHLFTLVVEVRLFVEKGTP